MKRPCIYLTLAGSLMLSVFAQQLDTLLHSIYAPPFGGVQRGSASAAGAALGSSGLSMDR